MSGSRRSAFAYALWRVVPSIERGECLNAGVVLFCRERGFLGARVELDPARLAALAPDADGEAIARRLEALARVAAGDRTAGPMAALAPSERFGWLAAPSSTVVQAGPVHTGLSDDPEATLEHLATSLVARPAPRGEVP